MIAREKSIIGFLSFVPFPRKTKIPAIIHER